MRRVERLFESVLWNSRFVVVFAVIASIAAAFATFFMSTVDVFYLIAHLTHYADPALGPTARDALRAETTTHIVEVVDGYLLATVMLIFALGLYELFVSDLAAARTSKGSSRILLIVSLDDLKSRLAKVIIMILIVKLFENALKLEFHSALDLLYLGGAIALIGIALYLTHGEEGHKPPQEHGGPQRP
ncbi:MAG TPA: YqhA family protein [Burkholderiales bacterium]|nr:YqhA family protein [Burkholderiales bacterium]